MEKELLINRLGQESLEIQERLLKLEQFLESDKVEHLTQTHYDLLIEQRYIMRSYISVLVKRVLDLR